MLPGGEVARLRQGRSKLPGGEVARLRRRPVQATRGAKGYLAARSPACDDGSAKAAGYTLGWAGRPQ